MDSLGSNPFAVLTFIAAPAILTNASSVMALGTSNRFARAIDRGRALAKELATPAGLTVEEAEFRCRQLGVANRRALLLVRALTAFYTSLGAFAAASFTSLLGAVFVVLGHEAGRQVGMVVALVCGVVGVAGLVAGSLLLVWETRLALRILGEETTFVHRRLRERVDGQAPAGGPGAAGG